MEASRFVPVPGQYALRNKLAAAHAPTQLATNLFFAHNHRSIRQESAIHAKGKVSGWSFPPVKDGFDNRFWILPG